MNLVILSCDALSYFTVIKRWSDVKILWKCWKMSYNLCMMHDFSFMLLFIAIHYGFHKKYLMKLFRIYYEVISLKIFDEVCRLPLEIVLFALAWKLCVLIAHGIPGQKLWMDIAIDYLILYLVLNVFHEFYTSSLVNETAWNFHLNIQNI